MATAREYFDRNVHLERGAEWPMTFDGTSVLVPIKWVYDFEGGSKHVKIFVPDCPFPDAVVAAIVLRKRDELSGIEKRVEVHSGVAGSTQSVSHSSLRFSGRVLVYTPTVIEDERWTALAKTLSEQGMDLLVRDGRYVDARNRLEKPLAFISHDSRDKDSFVRGLAAKLSAMLCPVWYDEYSLVPGQSLRESIERGLKTCAKCVVVLSKNFLSNPGWGRREFDMIYTREIIEGRRVMVPIWLDVTKQEVYDYSPILADTVGIPAAGGVEEVARKVVAALAYQAPKTTD